MIKGKESPSTRNVSGGGLSNFTYNLKRFLPGVLSCLLFPSLSVVSLSSLLNLLDDRWVNASISPAYALLVM